MVASPVGPIAGPDVASDLGPPRAYVSMSTKPVVMAATGFLKTNPNPTREELAHGISGNLCRCQDYDKILTALMRGAELMRG